MRSEIAKRKEPETEIVSNENWLTPAVDIFENEQEWRLVADLPGVVQDALKLHLHKNELTIEARRPVDDARALGVGVGNYRRTFLIPSGVDGEKVSAEMADGVVTIHLAKAEAIKPRRISVKAG